MLDIEKTIGEIEKMMGIAIARKIGARGNWWAFWFGRLEAYEEVLALLQGNDRAYMHYTIMSPKNLELAKTKGFLE